jgi:hypothetical protein
MLNDILRGQRVVRLTIFLGVLFGFGALALIYYAKKPAARTDTGPPPVPDNAQNIVVDALRLVTKRNIEVIHWWAPRNNGFLRSGAPVCRILYRLEGDPAEVRHDGAYEVVVDHANPLYDQIEGAKTHRALDPYFECKDCPFGIGKPPK